MTHLIPTLILFGYAVATVGVANSVLRRKLGSEHFLVAARSLPLFVVVAVVGGDMLGGASTVGVAQRGYTDGIVGSVFPLSLAAAFFVFAGTLAGRYRRLNAVTVPEIIGMLFGPQTRSIAAVVIALAYFLIAVTQILAGGSLLSSLLNVRPSTANLIITVMFGLIVVVGGLQSIALVNVIQIVVMLLGIALALVFSLSAVGGTVLGGFFRLWRELPPLYWSLGASRPLTLAGETLGTVLTLFAGQAAITGFLAAKDERTSVRAAWLTGMLFVLTAFPFALIGMCARLRFGTALPQGAASAGPAMMLSLHPIVASVALCGLLAAIVSTGPLCFLAPVQIAIRDVYLAYRPHPLERRLILLNRLLAVILLTCGWIVAENFNQILTIAIWGLAFRSSIAVVLLSVTYLGAHRVSETGALWGLIVGSIVFIGWTLAGTPLGLHVAIPSLIATFATTLAMSWLKPRRYTLAPDVQAAMYPSVQTESTRQKPSLPATSAL